LANDDDDDDDDEDEDDASMLADTPVVRSPEEISFDLLRLTMALRVGEAEEEETRSEERR
jgi:hypothetical protein